MLELMMTIVTTASIVMERGIYSNHCLYRVNWETADDWFSKDFVEKR